MIITDLGMEALSWLNRWDRRWNAARLGVTPGWNAQEGQDAHWELECISRGHPAYGPVAPGWPGAPDVCLCGARYHPEPSRDFHHEPDTKEPDVSGRKELILETEVLAALAEHDGARCLNTDHQSWESTAVIEYPRRWLPGKRRVLIIVTPEGRIVRRKV